MVDCDAESSQPVQFMKHTSDRGFVFSLCVDTDVRGALVRNFRLDDISHSVLKK